MAIICPMGLSSNLALILITTLSSIYYPYWYMRTEYSHTLYLYFGSTFISMYVLC
jgi:hypothetical protein